MLKAVRRLSVADAVYEQLRDSIVWGQIEPGTELPGERSLSERLEVNRGAVREALKRLEQARLVSIHPGGVTRVLDFRESASLELVTQLLSGPAGDLDLRVARSVIELRMAVAPDVARLATLRGRPELAQRLRELIDEMQACGADQARCAELAQLFWEVIVDHSQNVAYRLIFNTMRDVQARHGDLLRPFQSPSRELVGYQRIVEAIEKRDPELAAREAREQVELGAERLSRRIDALERG